MYFNREKKALFVIGMDQELPRLIQQATNIHPENMLTMQVYGPEISQPYGDLMRAIILAVYQENVEEIFVVGTSDDHRYDLRSNIYAQAEIEEKIETIDFLFKHCTPEFTRTTFNEWLGGSGTIIDGIQTSVTLIRNHPLMPSDLRVQGLLLNKENGGLSDVHVS